MKKHIIPAISLLLILILSGCGDNHMQVMIKQTTNTTDIYIDSKSLSADDPIVKSDGYFEIFYGNPFVSIPAFYLVTPIAMQKDLKLDFTDGIFLIGNNGKIYGSALNKPTEDQTEGVACTDYKKISFEKIDDPKNIIGLIAFSVITDRKEFIETTSYFKYKATAQKIIKKDNNTWYFIPDPHKSQSIMLKSGWLDNTGGEIITKKSLTTTFIP